MKALLLIGAVFVSAYIVFLFGEVCATMGWDEEQSQKILADLEKHGEELREKYGRSSG